DLPFHRRTEFSLSGNQLLDDESLAKRIQARQEPPNESLIHNGDSRCSCGVLLGEATPSHHLDSQRLVILWCDHLKAGSRAGGRVAHCLTSNVERHAETR